MKLKQNILVAGLYLISAMGMSPVARANAEDFSNNKMILHCASHNYHYSECYAGRGYVRLVRQVSSSSCIEGSSWGYNSWSGNIWVDRGCRADFEVMENSNDSLLVTCESNNYQYNRCGSGAYIGRAELESQYSNAPCVYGSSWGYDSQSIWVSNGCRAVFRTYRW